MLLGKIIGKSGTNQFTFLVEANAKKFMYCTLVYAGIGDDRMHPKSRCVLAVNT